MSPFPLEGERVPTPAAPPAEQNGQAHEPDDLSFLDGPAAQPTEPEAPAAQPKAKPAAERPVADLHDHDADDLDEAEYFGLDPVDVASLSKPQLKTQLRQLRAMERRRRWQAEANRDAPPVPAFPAAPQPQPAPAAPPADPFAEFEKAGYDPGLVALLRSQRAEIEALKAGFTEHQQQARQRDQMTAAERIDAAFEALGPDFAFHYGEGSVAEVSRNQMARRGVLLTAARIDWNNPPPLRTMVARLKAAHQIIHEQPARPEPEPEPAAPANPYAAAARMTAQPAPAAPPQPAPARNGNGVLYNRAGQPYDPRTGRLLPRDAPTEEQWDGMGLLRPSARAAPDPTQDRGHSGYADPDEFDLG